MREPVEQRRLAGIGVADQRDDRIRHALPAFAVKLARALDLFEFVFDPRNAVANQPPICCELAFARPAEETKTAALAFEMGPGPDQPALLVIEMRKLDLQHALAGMRAPAEDFEDQSDAIEHLGVPRLLEIALLHRRERAIHHHDAGLIGLDNAGELL